MKPLLWFLCVSSAWAVAPTVSITTIAATSPNSLTLAISTTNAVSLQAGCSTDHSHTILTPFIAVSTTSTVSTTMIAAQMQPATAYFCIATATDAAGGAGLSTTSAESASTTTLASRTSTRVLLTPGSGLTQGNTTNYNNQFYPTHYADGDTMIPICMANGSCVVNANDTTGVNGATSANLLVMGINSDITLISALNNMSSYGASNTNSCTTASSSWKGFATHAEGNTLYSTAYCQGGTPTWSDFSIIRSDDSGATWYNPAHTSGSANANGDAPTVGVAASRMVVGGSNFGMSDEWIECIGSGGWKGGVCDNPVDGLDAYAYLVSREPTGRYRTMFRAYRQSNFQAIASWQAYIGAVNGDVNVQANWSGTFASATFIFDESILACVGPRPYYFSDFSRYVVGCDHPTTYPNGSNPNDKDQFLFIQSASMLGWTDPSIAPTYLETATPPLAGAPWNTGASIGVKRQYIMPYQASYSFAAGSATVKMVFGGSYTQAQADEGHNVYSLMWTPFTITASPGASATTGVTFIGGIILK